MARPVHLFEIKPATRYDFGTQGMNYALGGDKYLRIPNEPEGISDQFLAVGWESVARSYYSGG